MWGRVVIVKLESLDIKTIRLTMCRGWEVKQLLKIERQVGGG